MTEELETRVAELEEQVRALGQALKEMKFLTEPLASNVFFETDPPAIRVLGNLHVNGEVFRQGERRMGVAMRLDQHDTRQVSTKSTRFVRYWGPFNVDTEGGALLILFDVNFAGTRESGMRHWSRLLLDGKEQRSGMAHGSGTWELGTYVLNHLTGPLPAGRHKIELQWRVNKGEAFYPHRNDRAGDTPSRRLIVLEIF